MIQVMLVDDHQVVRAGLAMLLESSDDLAVVGQAVDGDEAVELYTQVVPDVVLMDLSLPTMDGVAATREICLANPGARIVVLTSFPDRSRVTAALDAGACGYLLKDAQPDEIARAIRSAYEGGSPIDARVASNLLEDRRPVDPSALTPREREVLVLVGSGMLNKQVPRELNISEKTVKAHLGRIFNRLGVSDRTQAAVWAQRNGLLDS